MLILDIVVGVETVAHKQNQQQGIILLPGVQLVYLTIMVCSQVANRINMARDIAEPAVFR